MFVAEPLALVNYRNIIVHDRCISTTFLTYQKAKQNSVSLTTGAIKLIYELSVRSNAIVLIKLIRYRIIKSMLRKKNRYFSLEIKYHICFV